jgi:hypothetical protein
VHAVTEQTAEIADFLLELSVCGVGIAVRRENERVPALDADILVMLVAIGHAHVRVVAEKAGQGMANAGE